MAKENIFINTPDPHPDILLYRLLEFLKSLPASERTAVAAGVYSRESRNLTVATSRQFVRRLTGCKTWNHAEEEVLQLLRSTGIKFPIDPEVFQFVSTLSPCARPSSTRAHVSCAIRLTNSGFISEYTGKIDRNAAKTGEYARLNFTPNMTQDPVLLKVCDDLYSFFRPFKPRGSTKQSIIAAALDQLPARFARRTSGTHLGLELRT